jgi:hypothetical protein
MNSINVYSIYSGIYYQIVEEQFEKLDEGQIPLRKSPTSCKTCYSRGYIGFNPQTFTYKICKCVEKNIDYNKIKSKFNLQAKSV